MAKPESMLINYYYYDFTPVYQHLFNQYVPTRIMTQIRKLTFVKRKTYLYFTISTYLGPFTIIFIFTSEITFFKPL